MFNVQITFDVTKHLTKSAIVALTLGALLPLTASANSADDQFDRLLSEMLDVSEIAQALPGDSENTYIAPETSRSAQNCAYIYNLCTSRCSGMIVASGNYNAQNQKNQCFSSCIVSRNSCR